MHRKKGLSSDVSQIGHLLTPYSYDPTMKFVDIYVMGVCNVHTHVPWQIADVFGGASVEFVKFVKCDVDL